MDSSANRRRRPQGRPPHPDVLTPAEWRVLEQVRAGRTNAEIAVRLGVSVNTVRTHVSSMLAKLGLAHRHELAAWRGEPFAGRDRRHALLPPLLWIRDLMSSPAWSRSAVVAGVAVLAVAAVAGLASVGRGEGVPAQPDQHAPSAGEESAPLPPLPRATVSPQYNPSRFADLVAVLYWRQDPETTAYRPVQGIALFDPVTHELLATVDVEGGGVLARRRVLAGELLMTEVHPETGPYPDEFMARLLIFGASDQFALRRMIDLPRALTADRMLYQPTSFVLSSDERYLFYLRYERREGLADIMSIGIVDLDDHDPAVTVASLPRNCGGRVSIVPAHEDGAVALCGQLHQVFLIDPTGEVLAHEDFRDVGIEHGGFAFGFAPPGGGLAAMTRTGVVYIRGPEGGEQQHAILPSELRVHLWSDPFFTPEGTLVIGTHAERTDGRVEGLVEFDLSSFAITRQLTYEPARSFALTGRSPRDPAILMDDGSVGFPVSGRPGIPSVLGIVGASAEFDSAIALIP